MSVFDPNEQRTFVVQELGVGDPGATLVRFEWTARSRSAPRHGWEYGVRLRTKREDYPSGSEPTEQVLGSNYEPFDISGVWDNRWAQQALGPLDALNDGFAENQRKEFEKLVQRGNLVRLEFEGISITGLITNFRPTYFTKFRIGYKFSFSPHFRVVGGDTRAGNVLAPTVTDPVDAMRDADQAVNNARDFLNQAPAPLMALDVYSSIVSSVDDWQSRLDTINSVISVRTQQGATDAINPLGRVVQSFQSLRTSALLIPPLLYSARTDSTDVLAYEAAVLNLSFEEFAREISFTARQLAVICEKASRDLNRLVVNKVLAIYRPHAGESLYGVANKFYGNPFLWRNIYDQNNLSDIVLDGSQTLVIPDAGRIT